MNSTANLLGPWADRLEEHFSELAESRRSTGWPLFALEHGLDKSAVGDLERDVRASLRVSGPTQKYALPWIVYAAEFGYLYSGDEYWQTFASRTPGWQDRWRAWMRLSFHKFADRYHGATPKGKWADWFSIIAWPITHAVLPQDLQQQLAQLLFEVRWAYSERTFISAEALGAFLHRRSIDRSSRFQQFAENERLLGQIAGALLLESESSQQLLREETLGRIVNDISRHRRSQDWLSRARSSARTKVKGLKPLSPRGDCRPNGGHDEEEEPRFDLRDFQPRYFLIRSRDGTWRAGTEMPDFSTLLEQYPEFRAELAERSGWVGGKGGTRIARRRLLMESRVRIPLKKWPSAGEPALIIEGASPALREILNNGMESPQGARWLAKIGREGVAHVLKAKVAIPGKQYLFLSTKFVANPPPVMVRVNIDCEGLYGLLLDIPQTVDRRWGTYLNELGIESRRTLEVWPAGFPVAGWSEDGRVEIVEGQRFAIGAKSDFPISSLTASIGTRTWRWTSSDGGGSSEPLFLRLEGLRAGNDTLIVEANAKSTSGGGETLRGQLQVVVRRPRTEAADLYPLNLLLSPPQPSLEELWDGRCGIHLDAPGRSLIRVRVRFFKGDEEIYLHIVENVPLPLGASNWEELVTKARQIPEIGSAYDQCTKVMVEFDAGSIGARRFYAQREFTPLRWVVMDRGHKVVLVNHAEREPRIRLFTMTSPGTADDLDPATVVSGVAVDPPGALLLAEAANESATLIVAPARHLKSFRDLSVQPVAPIYPRRADSLQTALNLAANWELARLSGSSLAKMHRDAVVRAFMTRVFSVIGGSRWEVVERNIWKGNRPDSPGSLALAVEGGSGGAYLASALRAQLETLRNTTAEGRVEILHTEVREAIKPAIQYYEICRKISGTGQNSIEPLWATEFALRLACSPATALNWAGHRAIHGIGVLLELPVVARAARYLTIIVDNSPAPTSQSRIVWQWSEGSSQPNGVQHAL
jgi:hypothetical protein